MRNRYEVQMTLIWQIEAETSEEAIRKAEKEHIPKVGNFPGIVEIKTRLLPPFESRSKNLVQPYSTK